MHAAKWWETSARTLEEPCWSRLVIHLIQYRVSHIGLPTDLESQQTDQGLLALVLRGSLPLNIVSLLSPWLAPVLH